MTHTPGVWFQARTTRGWGVLHRYIDDMPAGWSKSIKAVPLTKAQQQTHKLCANCERRYQKQLREGLRSLGDAIAFVAGQEIAREAERASRLESFLSRVPEPEEEADHSALGLFVEVRGHVRQWVRKAIA